MLDAFSMPLSHFSHGDDFLTDYPNFTPTINIGCLGNSNDEKPIIESNIIHFEPNLLSIEDFKYCFFPGPLHYFHINSHLQNFRPLHFHSQKFAHLNNFQSFNLYNWVLKTYLEINQLSENNISAKDKINLLKETLNIKSLANSSKYQQTISFEDCLNHLGSSNQIIYTGNNNDSCKVIFIINYNFHSETLNHTIACKFSYLTQLKQYLPFSDKENDLFYSKNEITHHEMKKLKEELQAELLDQQKDDDQDTVATHQIINKNWDDLA